MPTENQLARATRADSVVAAARELLAEGHSQAEAARALGVTAATLCRWLNRHMRDGFSGLVPASTNAGRPSMERKFRAILGDAEYERVAALVKGVNHDTGSNRYAWRHFAQRAECPAAIRDYFAQRRRSKANIAPSLLEASHVTDAERKAHRGRRALSLAVYTPRFCDVLPGDIFSSDDTTPIWGWWVPWFEDDAHPHGVKLLQGQFLPLIDVASNCILTFTLVAREQSSYRAADIWALFGRAFRLAGLPRLGFQFERGVWESNLLNGVPMEEDAGEGALSHAQRVGGLRLLPSTPLPLHAERMNGAEFPKTLQIWRSYTPKSKIVESVFHRLQRREGMFWGALGRDQRGAPIERTKKVFEACRRGAEDPREHFLSGTEMVKQLAAAVRDFNHDRMEGEVFHGVPEELWADAVAAHPLTRLPAEQEHLFASDWSLSAVDESLFATGRITDAATGRKRSFHFTAPEHFARLVGRQVLVYFDAGAPEDGAHIRLARSGEYVCHAAFEPRRGMFLDGSPEGHESRRARTAAVMRLYGEAAEHAPSRQMPAALAARRAEAKHAGARALQPPRFAQPAAPAPAREVAPPAPARDLAKLYF